MAHRTAHGSSIRTRSCPRSGHGANPPTIFGDTSPQNVMVTALHDVDGVDLHITEMFHGSRNSLRSAPERRSVIEPLGAQPDAPGRSLGQGVEFLRAGHRAAM